MQGIAQLHSTMQVEEEKRALRTRQSNHFADLRKELDELKKQYWQVKRRVDEEENELKKMSALIDNKKAEQDAYSKICRDEMQAWWDIHRHNYYRLITVGEYYGTYAVSKRDVLKTEWTDDRFTPEGLVKAEYLKGLYFCVGFDDEYDPVNAWRAVDNSKCISW